MKKFSIFQKIWFGVGILVLGCFIAMVLGFVSSMNLGKDIRFLIQVQVPAAKYSLTAKNIFREQVNLYIDSVTTGDQAKTKLAQEKADEVQELLNTTSMLKFTDAESPAAVKKAIDDHKAYTDEAQKVIAGTSKGDPKAKENADTLNQKSEDLKNLLDKMNLDFTNVQQARLSEVVRISGDQRELNMGIFLVAVILSLIFMAIIIRRYVRRPLERVAVAVNEEAANVEDASRQVSSAGQSLSEGASNQASAIEETTSSLTEMAAMIKQNALNAGETDKLMKKNTNEVLRQANEAMDRLSKSIEDISGASEATRRIIKTIDEIAFQTNLLALNAAVEAARAGEAGAGFAVVADEVRALAMRSAEAAKETTRLIDNTIQTVNQGKEFAVAAQSTFAQNLDLSNKATTLVSEIATASNEQASGIEQMNRAMASIDEVVQQIAAHAEETASASEELNAQSGAMKGIAEELVDMLGMKRNQMMVASGRHPETDQKHDDLKIPLLR